MPMYIFRTQDANGQLHNGNSNAENLSILERRIKEKGHDLLSIREVGTSPSTPQWSIVLIIVAIVIVFIVLAVLYGTPRPRF